MARENATTTCNYSVARRMQHLAAKTARHRTLLGAERSAQPYGTKAVGGLKDNDVDRIVRGDATRVPSSTEDALWGESSAFFSRGGRWGESLCGGGWATGWTSGRGRPARAAASRTNQTTVIFVVAGPHFILLFVGGRFSVRCAPFFSNLAPRAPVWVCAVESAAQWGVCCGNSPQLKRFQLG